MCLPGVGILLRVVVLKQVDIKCAVLFSHVCLRVPEDLRIVKGRNFLAGFPLMPKWTSLHP